MLFRNDINGLRAIAVLLVIIYHFDSTIIPAGFIGVDVFFVISGYLMTSIIITKMHKEEFALTNFYAARVKRIVPPLLVLCLVLLVFGWFRLSPDDLTLLGKHVVGSITFVSNMVYWSESGYFDAGSSYKWLLHTWSLSVEWQFYMLFPVLMLVVNKLFSKDRLFGVLLALTVISFFVSLYLSRNFASFSYYSFPTRAWEMLAGGVVFLTPFKARFPRITECIGLVFILLSAFFFNDQTQWPAPYALLPVLGTVLIIFASRQESLLTKNPLFDPLGHWSYSIYLWHWPISVAIYYGFLEDNLIVSVLMSILLGAVSYYVVEKRSKKIPVLLATTTFAMSIMFYVFDVNKSLYRLPQGLTESYVRANVNCERISKYICSFEKSDSDPTFMVFGDSHAKMFLPVFEQLSKELNVGGVYSTYVGMAPVFDINSIRGDQRRINHLEVREAVKKYLVTSNVSTIFLISRWSYYTIGGYDKSDVSLLSSGTEESVNLKQSFLNFQNAFKSTILFLNQLGIKVYVVQQVPQQLGSPKKLYSDLYYVWSKLESIEDISVRRRENGEMQRPINEYLSSFEPDIEYVRTEPTYCNESFCFIGTKTRSYYSDDDHLSTFGANLMKPRFSDMIRVYN